MTWVVGCPSFGVSVAAADVRVSRGRAPIAEFGVKKLHTIAPNVVAGFAGDIEFGFALITQGRRSLEQLSTPQSEPVPVTLAFDLLPTSLACVGRRIRSAGPSAATDLLVIGCSGARSLVKGARVPFTQAMVLRFRDSPFGLPSVAEVPRLRAAAIGSGETAEQHRKSLELWLSDMNNAAQLANWESAQPNRGSAALLFGMCLGVGLAGDPDASISRELQVCAITRDSTWISPPMDLLDGGRRPDIPIATTWEETLELAESYGIGSARLTARPAGPR